MGASWLCLLILVWFFLFHSNKKFLVVSRNEEAVDKPGEPDSLFWKIDFVLEFLPDWLKSKKIKRLKRVFENPARRNYTTGQASTGKAGVGGRATGMFVDEVSQIEEAEELINRTDHTTECRIFNGTHLGVGTAFFKLTSGEIPINKVVMHWSEHPDKNRGLYAYDPERPTQPLILDKTYPFPPDYPFVLDGTPSGGPKPGVRSPWYDKKVKGKDKRAVAMDLDIDPQGSASQFFDPVVIHGLIRSGCRPPFWQGELEYDRESALPKKLVAMRNGLIKLWLHPTPDGGIPMGRYGAGGDVATGTGATPSTLSVVNGQTGRKVLEYANARIQPQDFAIFCAAILRLFRDDNGTEALFAWEQAGGTIFGPTFITTGYRNYYKKSDPFKDKFARTKIHDTPGWYPNPRAKNLLFSEYRMALSDKKFENPSEGALLQTLDFEYEKGTGNVIHSGEKAASDPSGARINHGDIATADALAWMVAKTLGWEGPEEEPPTRILPNSLAGRRRMYEDQQRQIAEAWL